MKIQVQNIEELVAHVSTTPMVWVGQQIVYRTGTHITYATFFAVVTTMLATAPGVVVPVEYNELIVETSGFPDDIRKAQEATTERIVAMKKKLQSIPALILMDGW